MPSLGIVRDPRFDHVGTVDEFTENIDIMPTLCEAMGIDVPAQCDGYPADPVPARRAAAASWRSAAYYEWDWRDVFIPHGDHEWPWDRRLERQNLAVRRSRDRAFVHFGDGSWRCFDLAADPTWQTEVTDAEVVLAEAAEMLSWRSRNLDRTMTDMLLQDGGIGRPSCTDHAPSRQLTIGPPAAGSAFMLASGAVRPSDASFTNPIAMSTTQGTSTATMIATLPAPPSRLGSRKGYGYQSAIGPRTRLYTR